MGQAATSELRKAVGDRDARALGHAAYARKSSVGAFGAEEEFKAAEKLEHLARQGDLTRVEEAYAALAGLPMVAEK